jgi:adenosylhomocysteine nucleosidase
MSLGNRVSTAARRAHASWAAALVVLAFACPVSAREKTDVLLAAAGEAELAPVLAKLAEAREERVAAWTFWTGSLGGKKVVVTRTEGDPLNAVAATTLALRRFEPALVLTFGVARPHDPTLKPLDVVVSERFAAFDGFISNRRELGAGAAMTEWRKLSHAPIAGEVETYTETFPANDAAKAAALSLTNPGGRVLSGVLGSAHQINRAADRMAWLRQARGGIGPSRSRSCSSFSPSRFLRHCVLPSVSTCSCRARRSSRSA